MSNIQMKGGREMNCASYSCSSYGQRSFLTNEEKIEMLKEYKESLEQEAQGVSERIVELEKTSK